MHYPKIAAKLRKRILQQHAAANTSHIGSVFSCLDILLFLYTTVLNVRPHQPDWPQRDRFILSKGHAANALYNVLAECKFFDEKLLDGYCLDGGKLPGHVTKGCVPGIEISAGSLGHGLPVGIGMAMAARMDRRPSRVFVLMSDGECDEGTTWESALLAAHHRLDNLTVIVDYNKIQSLGRTNEVLNLEPLVEKWRSFGWAVQEIDGHDYHQIAQAFPTAHAGEDKPGVVIAHTVKGKGVSFMEDKLEWHYRAPNEQQLKQAFAELDKI